MPETPARTELLPTISSPLDLHSFDTEQLAQLCEEVREQIITTVSKNGGHLAPNLGVVELTIALLKTFNPADDKIIWDVGHQAYAYKILTGRRDDFHTLRQFGGVSGFPRRAENPTYDHFGVGHSSTSISAALGMAVGRDLSRLDNKVIAVIGDGSLTAGMAYEGLNQAGGMEKDLVVVLNDNEMSISPNVGALSSFLSRNLSQPWLMRIKKEVEGMLKSIPRIGDELAQYARRGEESFKGFFTPGMLFQAFGFNYLGPIDGHNMQDLVNIFKQVRSLEGPVLVHVLTKKGKGYEPAETNPTYFHGVGCFEPETGNAPKISGCKLPSYTDVFGSTMCKLARKDENIVAITAAMPEGTGLVNFGREFPERLVDVGICEQHAVTFAAGLATQGFKPVVAVYSTFLQRSYDQIIHDVCLQNLPVAFCLDRGGLVGEDGATHHGVFDFSFLRHIPNLIVMAPKDEPELRDMVATCIAHDGPAAVRYPRGVGCGADFSDAPQALDIGRGEILRKGTDATVIAIGSRVLPALEVATELAEEGAEIAVLNARFVKPLPVDDILAVIENTERILIVEENAVAGGFGSAILELLVGKGLLGMKTIKLLGIPDDFVEHGPQKKLRQLLGIDRDGIKAALRELLAS